MAETRGKAVFLSYAHEDAAAAQRIAEALRAAGIEVWFDQSELTGGDAWDAKIKRQIQTCALFVPVISQHTQEREEGYFRLEWKLAEDRSHLMAKGKAFIVPVSVDGTAERDALVPDAFAAVQWTKLPAGASSAAFVARVRKLLGGEVTPATDRRTGAGAATEAGHRPAPPSKRLHPSWIWAALAMVVIGASALFITRPSGQPAAPSATAAKRSDQSAPTDKPAGASDKSIAVLAFENLSGERENEYFSDGISDELLNQLGRVPGLRVAGRTSAFSFKGKNVPEAEIAQKLGVAYIVNGTVQKSGTQVRITARLINAADGFQIWSDKFTKELKDAFALEDEIAGLVAQHLQLKLGYAPRTGRTVHPEAHRLVLEGRHFWNLRTPEGFASAEAAFRRALALDPQFAQAHAGLADVAVIRATYGLLDGETEVTGDLRRTREAAQRAQELDAVMPEPIAALAHASMLERELADSERGHQQALRANPNHSVFHMWRGVAQFYGGRLDVALAEFEKSVELDPLSFINLHMETEALALAGRLDEAIARGNRAAALRTDLWPPNRGELAVLLWRKGRKEEAVAAARSVRQLWPLKPRWFADGYAIWVLREAGLHEEASAYATQLLRELPQQNSHPGLVHAALGNLGAALPYLERSGIMIQRSLFWAAMWDQYRADPRFARLLAKLGCDAEYKVARETLALMMKQRAAGR